VYPTIRIRKGWYQAGRRGILFFTVGKNQYLGQEWAMVKWDDEDEPDCHKTSGLEYAPTGVCISNDVPIA
jgi:hypothetical protein